MERFYKNVKLYPSADNQIEKTETVDIEKTPKLSRAPQVVDKTMMKMKQDIINLMNEKRKHKNINHESYKQLKMQKKT